MHNGLFDTIERTDIDPSKYSEPEFEYVNRTNRPHFQKARAILEEWFEEYVTQNPKFAPDLWARFRSKDNEHHLAALTELYLHHLLLVNGFVPQAHPVLHDVATRPEFLAWRDKVPQFVAEAVLVYDDKIMARADKFEANIFDAVNAVNSPDFLISLNIRSQNPNTQPKSSSITKFLQNKVDKLDYDQACQENEGSNPYRNWTYTQGGWELEFTARPVTEDGRRRRNGSSRVIGTALRGLSVVDVDAAIRDNVMEKSKKYGKFEMPFIIVVNVIREKTYCDDEIIMDALYGREVVDYVTYKDGSDQTNVRRNLNGIWANPKAGLTNPHVSGILFLSGLTSGNIQETAPVLWHHPRAAYPLDMTELDVEQRYFEGESCELKKYNTK